MSGIVIGARTGSRGGGGSYSVFYNAVPFGEAFTEEAWVEGLQQNEENRSNLALVNTGEVDGSASVFHLEIYDGETGMLAETVVTQPIQARRWHQINGILGSYAPETRQGYIRIPEDGPGREPLSGLRSGQRRRGPGRAQRRRGLSAGWGVGAARDRPREKRYPRRGSTKRQKDIHEGDPRKGKKISTKGHEGRRATKGLEEAREGSAKGREGGKDFHR